MNISGEKPVSYYDFYRYLAKLLKIDSSFIIPDYKEEDRYHNLNNDKRKLLYVCDKIDLAPQILHITFLLERVGGEIKLPTNEFDQNYIYDVKMVDINKLTEYGFSKLFQNIVNFMKGGYLK